MTINTFILLSVLILIGFLQRDLLKHTGDIKFVVWAQVDGDSGSDTYLCRRPECGRHVCQLRLWSRRSQPFRKVSFLLFSAFKRKSLFLNLEPIHCRYETVQQLSVLRSCFKFCSKILIQQNLNYNLFISNTHFEYDSCLCGGWWWVMFTVP